MMAGGDGETARSSGEGSAAKAKTWLHKGSLSPPIKILPTLPTMIRYLDFDYYFAILQASWAIVVKSHVKAPLA